MSYIQSGQSHQDAGDYDVVPLGVTILEVGRHVTELFGLHALNHCFYPCHERNDKDTVPLNEDPEEAGQI